MGRSKAVDSLFKQAYTIIEGLPARRESWYRVVDVSSESNCRAWKRAGEDLLRLAAEAPEHKPHFQIWASDVYIGLAELEKAVALRPVASLGSRSSSLSDDMLSLKLELGQAVSGAEIAGLFGPNLTEFGRSHISEVIDYLDVQLATLQGREGLNLLREWSSEARRGPAYGWYLFVGTPGVMAKFPPQFLFSYSQTAETMCAALMREAENTLREEKDLPRVGEGWVAETALYYDVREAFPDEEVIQHGRPNWLGRQHLDIYLPGRGVAIEYQGAQHDQPVEFFGGLEAYQRTLARDRRKLARCRKNGVRVIYVRPGYVLGEVVGKILALSSS